MNITKENPSAATDGLLTTTTPSSDLKETKMSDFNGSTDAPQISLPEAEKFLELLDGLDTAYTFQTIPNQVSGRSANTLHGCIYDLRDQLTAANQQGDGAFVTVNETDGQGRKASNIIRVRAIFVDKDDGRLHELRNLPLPPHK
ncbi:hypothetical protein [Endozoicomonas acroporae]|uniref:hypothetical protein n=1 Tax=Endozoicomonas acroporae TaxID=1701104 RepID=UPI0013D4541F|nr:hypothetical protein [Endozoicomonas acroporae]